MTTTPENPPVTETLLDLARLSPGPTGRQNDRDVAGDMTRFRVLSIIAVPLVEEIVTGDRFFADPEALRHRQLELHPWLVAKADIGTITDTDTLKTLLVEEARKRLSDAIARGQTEVTAVAGDVGPELAALLDAVKPRLVERVTLALLGILR